jgi:hypothetical protein
LLKKMRNLGITLISINPIDRAGKELEPASE